MSVYVRPRGVRWQVVSEPDDSETLAVLMDSGVKFRAVAYAARLLDVEPEAVDVRE